MEREGKVIWKSVKTEIVGLKTGNEDVEEVTPGGSVGILTSLDPSIVKSDNLVGNVVSYEGKAPDVYYEFNLKPTLLERIVGAKDELVVSPIKKSEVLMLNVNSSATVGTVIELKKNLIHVKLRIPVCCNKDDRITISRVLNNRWRLIGWSNIV